MAVFPTTGRSTTGTSVLPTRFPDAAVELQPAGSPLPGTERAPDADASTGSTAAEGPESLSGYPAYISNPTMADVTTHDERMTREDVADVLRSIADEMDSGRADARIPVGNKEVTTRPSDDIDAEVTVTERSRRLRKDVEELALTFAWNPTRQSGGSDAEDDQDERETAAGTDADGDPGTDR